MQPLGAYDILRNLASHREHFCSPSSSAAACTMLPAKAAIFKRPFAGSSCPILLEIAPADQPCRHAYEVFLCAQPAQAATAILPRAPGSLKGHPPRPASADRHGASPGAQDPPEAPSPPSQHCPGTTIPRSPCTRLRRALYRPGSAPAHGAAEVLPI